MKRTLRLLVILLAATAGAQGQPASPAATSPANSAAAKRITPAKTTKAGKAVIPDPDILDGSKFEPEKRPLYGMLSEIEMGEEEGGKSDRVSPNSGPAGGAKSSEKSGGAGADQKGGGAEKIAEGPEAKPEGTQVADLKVPEGAAAAPAGQEAAKPRELKIGDATLQIQTIGANIPSVIGQEASNAQQYEKKLPSGQQTNNRNQGVEKGRVIPKGL